jgi:homoserine trans-succinylase
VGLHFCLRRVARILLSAANQEPNKEGGPLFNYFPDNDPELAPRMTWRAHRNLLFGNWINIVYQGTPYDLVELKPVV